MAGDNLSGARRGATTIAARATAQGSGAIAIVRLSGPQSKDIVESLLEPADGRVRPLEPRMLRHGHLIDEKGGRLDEVLCVYMPGPGSYTGEDTAEIYCHGGEYVVSSILRALFARGAVPARRGEFSYRAFLNGRMDLSQAEAVAETIAAQSREALDQSLRRLDGELGRRVRDLRARLDDVRAHMSLAVDFPEDEVEILDRSDFLARVREVEEALRALLAGVARGRVAREGARVVLAGAANAGKSSLLNAILGRNRALVTDVPGTTRDFLEEGALLGDLPVRLVDTAGVRESRDAVEALGVERSLEQVERARCVVLVLDGAGHAPGTFFGGTCPDEVADGILAGLRDRDDVCVVVARNKNDVSPLPGCRDHLLPGDLWPAWVREHPVCRAVVAVSATTGDGVDVLCREVAKAVLDTLPEGGAEVAPNDRQARDLGLALTDLEALVRDIEAGQMYDLLSVHLDGCCGHLDDCIGVGTAEDVLNRVFENFCIGK